MDQTPQTQKDRLMKTFAVFGFLAVIILGVWLAVQIVSLMPQAFTSLASIADGVYNYQYQTPTELTVNTSNSIINSGDSFTLSWTSLREAGEYTFSYTCGNGLALTTTDNEGATTELRCNTSLSLPQDADSLSLQVTSERQRTNELQYTLAFFADGNPTPIASNNSVTVVNPSIPEGGIAEVDVPETVDEETAEEVVVDETTEPETPVDPVPEIETPTEPEVSTPLPPAPTFIETVTMGTPVSDPNGRTDLAVRLVAVGHLTSDGNFVQRGNIDEDARGAYQFEVKNVGTKTSTEWDFLATLTSGTEYNAPEQAPLKPQERVVFTLGYDNVGDNGISMIGVTIRGGSDTNRTNNSFTWAVSVVE